MTRATFGRGRTRSPKRADGDLRAAWCDALLKVSDAGLAGAIFAAPLVLGGRHEVGRLVFSGFVALAAAGWFVRQALLQRRTCVPLPVALFIGCAALVLAMQLVPMPASWIGALSPRIHALLPLWSGEKMPGSLGGWSTLSLDPEATRLSLAMLAAYALVFVTVYERAEHQADVARFVQWVGLSAGLMAVTGLLQYVAPNGKFLWVYDHPYRDATDRLSGAFVNGNHFAHFLALGAPALAAALILRLQRLSTTPLVRLPSLGQRGAAAPAHDISDANRTPPSRGRETRFSWERCETFGLAALLVIVATAVLISCSRGGALALAVSTIAAGASLYYGGLLRGTRLTAIVAAVGAVFLAVSAIDYDRVAERLNSLASLSLDNVDERGGRRKIWQANVQAIRDGGAFGAGAGTHSQIYPAYMSDPPIVRYTHAESSYLQIVTEIGWCGGILLVAGLALAGLWTQRALRNAATAELFAYAGACAGAIAASAVHAVFDFVWHIPACMCLTLALIACLLRIANSSERSQPASSGEAGSCTALPWAVGASLGAVFAVSQFVAPAAAAPSWDAYLRMAVSHRDFAERLSAMEPQEWSANRAATYEAEVAAITTMIDALEQVAKKRPEFAPAHRQLANRYVQLFSLQQERADNSLPLPQIRDSAVASHFESAAAVRDWLERAFGSRAAMLYHARAHARRAVALAPLEGEPYVRLAELGFLEGQGFAEADRLLQQATLVRPFDGDLLFEIGAQWAARGVNQWALECWKRAFQTAGPHRRQIARALAGEIPSADLLAILAPHWDTLPIIWRSCQAKAPQDAPVVLAYAEEETRRETTLADRRRAAAIWRALADMQREAGLAPAALASLERSCQAVPEDYASRRLLGLALYEAGRFAEGDEHLRWCLDRKPNDTAIKRALMHMSRQRYAAQPTVNR